MQEPLFHDRRDAGQVLARRLSAYRARPDTLVLALPRGGVPVGHAVAQALGLPLDVFVVRKLGVPGHGEFAMGAIASGGVRVMNGDVVRMLGIAAAQIEVVAQAEALELARREQLYRDARPALVIAQRTVLLVDDGIATGATMRAAARALRAMNPARIVIAVPTGARSTCHALRREADEVVCATTPEPFRAVGCWYEDFAQTSDEEVRSLLQP
ncbi:phosphoribosyltransferase [Rhizobacter sp. OV335]|uniref:phosphoribosyltransferase n=1 Tax=Rhizobacter sp. OV335 TaxID=1500264 RepID=UPI000914C2AF|nr:phosphoribosyltransferase [Rhizobacter sp. OV335]SHM23934.1 Predicted phosphoribosyltransferase [Rhizobacter sp. OV335]